VAEQSARGRSRAQERRPRGVSAVGGKPEFSEGLALSGLSVVTFVDFKRTLHKPRPPELILFFQPFERRPRIGVGRINHSSDLEAPLPAHHSRTRWA
jgi:hypothetical protein